MKKRLLLKLGLVGVLGTALFVAWLWWMEPTTGICRRTAQRIQVGMSVQEVNTIIGTSSYVIENNIRPKYPERRFWGEGDQVIMVQFDREGLVHHVEFCHYTFFNRLCRWLHLD